MILFDCQMLTDFHNSSNSRLSSDSLVIYLFILVKKVKTIGRRRDAVDGR